MYVQDDPTEPMFQWSDITCDFLSSCNDLKLGELVSDANFSLFDAMSAIELMDPKMDAGVQICEQVRSGSQPLTFDSAVQQSKLPLKQISFQNLTSNMDFTLSCLTTWLEGHSLAQTVFTNLYMHQPNRIENIYLKSFMLAIWRLVGLIRSIITHACVFEEEDFQPMMYGFLFPEVIHEQKIISMLKESEDLLAKEIKRNGQSETEQVAMLAVQARLKFVRSIWVSLILLTDADVHNKLPTTVPSTKLFSRFVETQKWLTQSEYALLNAVQCLDQMISTVEEQENDAQERVVGVEPFVNQKLLPPTFPRHCQIKCRVDTYAYWRNVTQRLRAVCQLPLQTPVVFDVVLVGFSRQRYWDNDYFKDFVRDFSLRENCILTRSVCQLAYFNNNTPDTLRSHISEGIRQLTQAPVLCSPQFNLLNDSESQMMFDSLMLNSQRTLHALVRIAGNNRARQRDKYAQILEEISLLQDEADKVDCDLQQKLDFSSRIHIGCLSSYFLYHTILVMINYLLLHIELQLYAPYEYVYVYWYLFAVLYKWLVKVLERADESVLQQAQINAQDEKINATKNGKKQRRKKIAKPKLHTFEIMQQKAYLELCKCYFKAFFALQVAGKLKLPKFGCSSEQMVRTRYEHRFLPFSRIITPTYCNFVDFSKTSGFFQILLGDLKPEVIYSDASRSFEATKDCFEQFSMGESNIEINSMIKLCKHNSIVMGLLAKGHLKGSEKVPDIDFTLNRCFPQFKL